MINIQRPQPTECDPFYWKYIEQVPEGDVLEFLKKQKREFMDYVSRLNPDQLDFTYEPGKWSRRVVIGHILDTERVMAYRGLCISKGDRTLLPGFDQDIYVGQSNFSKRSSDSMIREFDALRTSNIEMISSWDQPQLDLVGNANGSEVSLRAIVYIIAGHLQHHRNILREKYDKK